MDEQSAPDRVMMLCGPHQYPTSSPVYVCQPLPVLLSVRTNAVHIDVRINPCYDMPAICVQMPLETTRVNHITDAMVHNPRDPGPR